jgi:hypothetical protein
LPERPAQLVENYYGRSLDLSRMLVCRKARFDPQRSPL